MTTYRSKYRANLAHMFTFFLGLLASPAAHHDGPTIPPSANDSKLAVPVARLEAHLEPCAPHQVKAVLFYYSLISLFVCHILIPLKVYLLSANLHALA